MPTIQVDPRITVERPGDLVTFPQGLSCTWHVGRAVRKHCRFG